MKQNYYGSGVQLIALTVMLTGGLARAGAEEAAGAGAGTGIEIYNFLQLIDKAERIVLGEIGERKDGRVAIATLETLKAPALAAREGQKISPEAYALAEERLKSGKAGAAGGGKDAQKEPGLTLLVNAEMRLPPAGVQAVFFLWHGEKADDEAAGTFTIRHPQCIYDVNVLPQVRAAIFKPRSISDGRYLRDWDRRAAEKLAQRKADDELKHLPAGETVLGMRLDCVRPQLALRGDNSFLVKTNLNNIFGKELLVYDGPAGAYGAILRAKDAPPEKSIVLRLGGFEGIDPVALNVTTLLDFESIQGNQLLSREHSFDVPKFPILKTLTGTYLLKMFYINTHDGMIKERPKEGLESAAWTGILVSKEASLEFKPLK